MPMQDRLLIVEDDQALRARLTRALQERGFDVHAVATESEAVAAAGSWQPTCALVDLKLAGGNGISVVAGLREACPGCRSVILTAYGNIPSAVAAIKAGALDCLPKPSDADDIAIVLRGCTRESIALGDHQMTPSEARLAHILAMFEESQNNITLTARRLGMHRRTLQRILARHDPDRLKVLGCSE